MGGLSCNRETLQVYLEKTYGRILEIFIPFHSETSYAFVTFENPQHAQRAIKHSSGNEKFYQEIKEAKVMKPRLKSAERQRRRQLDWTIKQKIARESTILIQIHKSHVERMIDFLQEQQASELQIEVVGSCDTDSRSISLLGVKMSTGIDHNEDDANKLQAWFQKLPIQLRGLNKVYSVNPLKSFTATGTKNNHMELAMRCLDEIKNLVDKNPEVRIRFNVFPPSLATSLFQKLQILNAENDEVKMLLNTLSPTEFTHTLDIVQIMSAEGRKGDARNTLYLMGIRPVANDKSQIVLSDTRSKLVDSEEEICRAYHKLQEAFFRYLHPLPPSPKVALDCGAAPGGWTKFLLDEISDSINVVYSIDPARLSPVVSNNPRVQHLTMKVEDAMQFFSDKRKIAGEGNAQIDLWVSDMCLHHMSTQVDLFLAYKECGIVGPGTFFILTLKCKVGHSKESFDAQVAEQRARLESSASYLQTLHLFSNRSGERTLMGYLK